MTRRQSCAEIFWLQSIMSCPRPARAGTVGDTGAV